MPGQNDVEIRVRVRNDTRAGLNDVERDARLAGGRAGGAFGDQFTRDANGRLHDQRGRYVSEGALAGQSYARGFGGSASKGLKETFGKAFKDAGMAAALASNPIGGLIGTTTALVGALALLPAAALAGGAAFAVLKIGTKGFGDALSSMDDPAKFAEAVGKLAPNAQAAAKAVKSLKPELDGLKRVVQDTLFRGMADEIKQVGGNLLPTLKLGLAQVAAGANAMGKGLAAALKTPQAKNDLAVTLKNTGQMLTNMKPVLGNIVSGFLSLGAAGSKFLPRFGTWLSDITTKFKSWAEEANRTGKAQTWIQNALDEFKELGGILKDLGSMGKSLAEAFGDASILQTIHGITSGVAEWLAKNKELLPILLNLFAAWKAFSAVKGILTGITGGLSALATAAGRAGTATGAGQGGLLGNLKLLKGLGIAAGIAVVADQLDKANVAAAGGEENLTGWNEQLHDFVGMGKTIASGDFDTMFKDIGDQWKSLVDQFNSGESLVGSLRPTMLAQKLFGNSSVFLGDAFKQSLAGVDKAYLQWRTALAPVSIRFEGDITGARDGVANVVNFANGQTGTVTVGANGQPAMVTVDGVKYNVDATTGIMTLAANQDPALGTLSGTKATIDGTTGRLILDANDAPARAKIANLISTASQTVYMNISAFASSLPTFKSAVGGGAHGLTLVGERGPELVRGMANGGAGGGGRGGMSLVGAGGPELVKLGAGSSVLPYSNTAQTLRSAAQDGSGGAIQVELKAAPGGDQGVATLIMKLIRMGSIQITAANISGLR